MNSRSLLYLVDDEIVEDLGIPEADDANNAEGSSSLAKDPGRFYCPFPGCTRSFAELWRLKVHFRAPPDIRGSGKERGHGTELTHCPKCNKNLKPGKHHVRCSQNRNVTKETSKRSKRDNESDEGLDESEKGQEVDVKRIKQVETNHTVTSQMPSPAVAESLQMFPKPQPTNAPVNPVINLAENYTPAPTGQPWAPQVAVQYPYPSYMPAPLPGMDYAPPQSMQPTYQQQAMAAHAAAMLPPGHAHQYHYWSPAFSAPPGVHVLPHQNHQLSPHMVLPGNQPYMLLVQGPSGPSVAQVQMPGQIQPPQGMPQGIPQLIAMHPYGMQMISGAIGGVYPYGMPFHPSMTPPIAQGPSNNMPMYALPQQALPIAPQQQPSPTPNMQLPQPAPVVPPQAPKLETPPPESRPPSQNHVGSPTATEVCRRVKSASPSPPPPPVSAASPEVETKPLSHTSAIDSNLCFPFSSRSPSPPAALPEWEPCKLFNFTKFNQKLPPQQSDIMERVNSNLSMFGVELDEGDKLYEAFDEGDIMQMLFGAVDEQPTMAMFHLHRWADTECSSGPPSPPSMLSDRHSGESEVGPSTVESHQQGAQKNKEGADMFDGQQQQQHKQQRPDSRSMSSHQDHIILSTSTSIQLLVNQHSPATGTNVRG